MLTAGGMLVLVLGLMVFLIALGLWPIAILVAIALAVTLIAVYVNRPDDGRRGRWI